MTAFPEVKLINRIDAVWAQREREMEQRNFKRASAYRQLFALVKFGRMIGKCGLKISDIVGVS